MDIPAQIANITIPLVLTLFSKIIFYIFVLNIVFL